MSEKLKVSPRFYILEQPDGETKVLPIEDEEKSVPVFGDNNLGGFAVIRSKEGYIKIVGRFDKGSALTFGSEENRSHITPVGV